MRSTRLSLPYWFKVTATTGCPYPTKFLSNRSFSSLIILPTTTTNTDCQWVSPPPNAPSPTPTVRNIQRPHEIETQMYSSNLILIFRMRFPASLSSINTQNHDLWAWQNFADNSTSSHVNVETFPYLLNALEQTGLICEARSLVIIKQSFSV